MTVGLCDMIWRIELSMLMVLTFVTILINALAVRRKIYMFFEGQPRLEIFVFYVEYLKVYFNQGRFASFVQIVRYFFAIWATIKRQLICPNLLHS